VLTVSFVPSAENPKMALSTPRDPTTAHTMIKILSIFVALFIYLPLALSVLPSGARDA